VSDAETQPGIAYDLLQPGDWIETEQIVTDTGVRPEDGDAWRFAMLRVQEKVEKRRHLLARIDTESNRVRVMTFPEADEHNFKQGMNAATRLARSADRTRLIQRQGMTDAEKRTADGRQLALQSVSGAVRREARAQRRQLGSLMPKKIAAGPGRESWEEEERSE